MKYRTSSNEVINLLKKEKINTWFDIGLFIDRLREEKNLNTSYFSGSYDDYKKLLKESGVAFLTFYYSIDGVTVEVEKYAKIFRSLYGSEIHYIAGAFYPESKPLIHKDTKKFEISECNGFDDWKLYESFFNTKLDRGGELYNKLIFEFWDEVLVIVGKLAEYVEKNNIGLLYLLNVCSNPGNVSYCLATILVSEFMGIPVINNSHDFYWEGGNSKTNKKVKLLPDGPRDFFFTNSHIGEFFSLIETLYPWESRIWQSVHINRKQTEHVIKINGHNPANVCEIGTAVDTVDYSNISKRKKLETLKQFEKVFSRNSAQLVAYSIDGVIDNELVDLENPHPILIGNETKVFKNFVDENIIFLQPTRIVSRKRIEVGFRLIKELFENTKFLNKFYESPNLKLTILVTGPIPPGQGNYFKKLIIRFKELLDSFPEEKASRIHLGFMFSEFDKKSFKKKFKFPIGIPELYNVASLILLPSKTEGRGLPIIEAAASGIPIFCRRYFPENVYSEVIGEHLPENERLRVIEYKGKKITSNHVRSITQRVFFAHKYVFEIKHNKEVVKKRYSITSLSENIEEIVNKLYIQQLDNQPSINYVQNSFKKYKEINNKDIDLYSQLINNENRYFMQGYGNLSFMIYLKSLIDPSYFRVEEQKIRGRAMEFARKQINTDSKYHKLSTETIHSFYNAVDNLFKYYEGQQKIKHDHSFAYRHRNTNNYPFQDYTFQELTGLVNLIHNEIIKPTYQIKIDSSSHFFTNWNLSLSQITSSHKIEIDNRKFLRDRLRDGVPIAYFPGKYVTYELELFALQSVRYKLNIPVEKALKKEIILKEKKKLAAIYIFALKNSLVGWSSAEDIRNYIFSGVEQDLKVLYECDLIKIIPTEQLSVGLNIKQLGADALKTLIKIKEKNGFIISTQKNSAVMTDIIDIDKFHIGNIKTEITSNIMGIPVGSGYIQFVPAGVRTCLAFPTPIQNSKQFSETINGDLFMYLCDEFGQKKVFKFIREDAIVNGNPINKVLRNIKQKGKKTDTVESNQLSGIHTDGLPYSGAYAKINTKKLPLKFAILSSNNGTKTVGEFIDKFVKNSDKKVRVGWNGGYILNPELVGKLGLPESFIGSPLGLIISNGKVLSPPLFNKAALLINKDGKPDIKMVNSAGSFTIKAIGKEFKFDNRLYNIDDKDEINKLNICYYDLLHKNDKIFGNGRVILRLSGNVVKEIVNTEIGEYCSLYPVGLSFSFKKDIFPNGLEIGDELEFYYPEFEDIISAVEAGPFLLNEGNEAINMELEGWKSANSIKTQAARLDYTDMRGPKIAVGIDNNDNIFVLTINGRIRESVGATHNDMAAILKKYGMVKAMGFDPGGSSTLVVDNETLNISPYNKNYEENIYALPPQARAVANAVLIYEG